MIFWHFVTLRNIFSSYFLQKTTNNKNSKIQWIRVNFWWIMFLSWGNFRFDSFQKRFENNDCWKLYLWPRRYNNLECQNTSQRKTLRRDWSIPRFLLMSNLNTKRKLSKSTLKKKSIMIRDLRGKDPKKKDHPEKKGLSLIGTKMTLLSKPKLLRSLRRWSKNQTLKSIKKDFKNWKLKGKTSKPKDRHLSKSKESSSEISMKAKRMVEKPTPNILELSDKKWTWKIRSERKLEQLMTTRKNFMLKLTILKLKFKNSEDPRIVKVYHSRLFKWE